MMRADTAACENLFIFLYDRFADEPEEGVVFDPVAQKPGARYGRLGAKLPEAAIPATSTEVSTIPLGRPFLG